jgi:hypothetical protein
METQILKGNSPEDLKEKTNPFWEIPTRGSSGRRWEIW